MYENSSQTSKPVSRACDDDYINTAWDMLRESIMEVRRLIIWRREIQINNRALNTQVDNAIRRVRVVYRYVLEECVNIKNFSKQCEYMQQCQQAEIKSRNLGVDTFLWQHRLESYKGLFESKGTEYLSEIVEMELTHDLENNFKDSMEPLDSDALMNVIDKAKHGNYYIQHCMEEDLTRLGNQCERSSEKVSLLLNGSLSETQNVTLSIVRYKESQKSMNKTASVGFKVLSALGQLAVVGGLLTLSLPGVIFAGVGAAATGGGVTGTVATQNEVARITEQIKDIDSMMSYWKGIIQHGITSWEELIMKFKELGTLLKEGVIKLEEEELYDITSHFQAAEKCLRNFSKQINDFAEEVQLLFDTRLS
ncbi:uncharacterized protein [Ptychodera flava]|uniref:uncharacterized protein n=1 Tax=Ptychodera flava TaxID=63121 RepID=UPI00396A33FC